MLRYLLDTNAMIRLQRGVGDRVYDAAQRRGIDRIATSSIVLFELAYGAGKSSRPAANLAALKAMPFPVLRFDEEAALIAGRVRSELHRIGQPIGPFDVQIAGHAMAVGLILVTANIGEFERVDGLSFEDWG
jgi:tRNA(fMet)-specific endonuclease VapC